MFSEVMEFFGLEKELDHLGFFETTSQKHLAKELKLAIAQGRLIALSGATINYDKVGQAWTNHPLI